MPTEMSASDLDTFLRDPIGRYVAGKSYLVFCQDATLRGHVVWGCPTVEEMSAMVHALAIAARERDVPYRWFVDLRDLSLIEPRSFQLMVDFVRDNARVLARNVIRQAQLRPPGMLGAIISGFSAIARLPYTERVFDDAGAAFDWLGLEPRRGAELLDALSALRARPTVMDCRLDSLEALLARTPEASVETIARSMHLSKRQLQRLLAEANTTFRGEASRARLNKARRMLSEPDVKLAAVALELGFTAQQHFSTWFKKTTGESPSDWRRRVALTEMTAD